MGVGEARKRSRASPVGRQTVVATISPEGWVDFPHKPEGVEVEVYDFQSDTKSAELVQQELEEALDRVGGRNS